MILNAELKHITRMIEILNTMRNAPVSTTAIFHDSNGELLGRVEYTPDADGYAFIPESEDS